MAKYAANTEVSTDRSRAEIERTLVRYGATGFAYGWDTSEQGALSVVGFRMHGRQVQFRIPMPLRKEFMWTENRKRRTSEAAIDAAWEQAQRQRWRALLLVIKAKLEAVDAGISDFESEFLPAMVLPGAGGRTVGDVMLPIVEQAYESGRFELPPLLMGLASPQDIPQLVEGEIVDE